MKKTISLFMAIAMVLSVFSGIGISAFAAELQSAVFNPVKPIELVEGVGGYWCEDEDGNTYFVYDYSFCTGDTVIVTMSDGTEIAYKYTEDEYDFFDEEGNCLYYYVTSNQYEEAWGLGKHSLTMIIYDMETEAEITLDIPVTIVENPVESAEFFFKDSQTAEMMIVQNTEGYWDIDLDNNSYFNYNIVNSFEEGSKIVIKMKDGSSVTYINTVFDFPEEGWFYYAFVNEDGKELILTQDPQYDNPWGIGKHTAVITVEDYGVEFEVPVEILKGSQQDCWHTFDEWKLSGGLYAKCCIGCGYEVKLPFKDILLCKSYLDYVAYTSVYNQFIAGTNPPEYTKFSPTTSITRAMFVAILYRMAGNPYDHNNPHKTNPFTDIQPGAYYYNAACWALDEGITNQTTFKPNDNVTREQTARFLFAYAEANDMLGDEEYLNTDISDYPDYDSVHSWAVEPLQWANYNDMMTGTSQGYINPQGATQRIHATRILYGFGYACNIGNFE